MHLSKASALTLALAVSQATAFPAQHQNRAFSPLSNLLDIFGNIARNPSAIASLNDAVEAVQDILGSSSPLDNFVECKELGTTGVLPGNCKACVGTSIGKECAWDVTKASSPPQCVPKPAKPIKDRHLLLVEECQSAYEATPAGKIDVAWNAMAKHVFGTDGNTDPWSGRHTLRAFRKGLATIPGVCDTTSDLCYFAKSGTGSSGRTKSVFGDSYSEANVETICKAAIGFNLKNGAAALGSYVVNNGFGQKICVAHQNKGEDGSCYPNGINVSTGTVGTKCADGTGNTPATSTPAPF